MNGRRERFGAQRGVSLVETMVGTSISVLIVGALGMMMSQMGSITHQQQNALTFNEQVQNAGTLLGRDASSAARAVIASGPSSRTLTLYVPTYGFGVVGDAVQETIVYTYSGDDQTLLRSQGDAQAIVARRLLDVEFGPDGEVTDDVNVVLTYGPPLERSTTLVLRLQPSVHGQEEG